MHTLGAIPFFKDATDIGLEPFARRVNWKKFETGQIIFDFEDKTDEVAFLMAGDVRILVRTPGGKEIILNDMHAGQFFGELAAIDGIPRSANVSALTRGEVCIMSAAVFREIVYASRILTERLAKLLTSRVRDLNSRIIEHTVLDVRHRLYADLLRQSQPRSGHPAERIVSPPPFHHVLAGRVGCRREQVTRELSAMFTEGLAEKTRGGLVLKTPEKLRERISSALRDGS